MSINLMGDPEFVLFDTKLDGELYNALVKKNWREVLDLCRKYSDGPFYTLTKRKDTVLHLALYSMQVGLVLSLLDDNYLTQDHRKKFNHQNSSGNTILHEAATQDNCIEAAKRIMQLEPQLLSIPNTKEETPIFRAVRYGQMDMFKFLNSQVERFFPTEEHRIMFYKLKARESSKKKKATSDTRKNKEKKVDPTYNILHVSIYHEHFELAYYIAKKFPYFIGEKNQHGMTGLQILSMNPSAFKNRDQGWFKYLFQDSCPLAPHCRVPWCDKIRREWQRYDAVVMLANFLIEEDTAWIHEQDEKPTPNADDEVEKTETPPTPLILATKWGCLEIVREILRQHPQTVEQVGREYGSILHIAIKYRRIEIFDMVEKMEMPMRRLVRKKDRNENSILHMVGENITDHKNASCTCMHMVGEKKTDHDKNASGTRSNLPWDVQEIEYETHTPAFELQEDMLLFEVR